MAVGSFLSVQYSAITNKVATSLLSFSELGQ